MARKVVEEQGERKTSKKGDVTKKGTNQEETGDVTHSTFELTSQMTSEQEVKTEKTKTKDNDSPVDLYSASLRLKQICSNYTSSIQKPTPKSQERKTRNQETGSSEEDEDLTFEFSKKLIAIAREKRIENKRERYSRKRKASGNSVDYGNGVLKSRRQRLSQSQLRFEENEDSGLVNASSYDDNQRSNYEGIMMIKSGKMWNTQDFKSASMDHEFSRKLTELSRMNQQYQPHEHAHCCRCVQSFECFWPRSNLQIIRRQAFC